MENLRILENITNFNNSNITNNEQTNKCEMFGAFGFIIQAVLGAAAFCILIFKRYIEKPRRPWKVWWYDVSKQIISSVVIHLFNLILSAILTDDKEETDSCVWYFVSLFLDCTLGAFFSYIFMWLFDGIAKASEWDSFQSGLYYEEYYKNNKKHYRLKKKLYFYQLIVWLIITIIVKIILLTMLNIAKEFMINLGTFALCPFKSNKMRLIMVLVIFPVILDGLYFWVADNILKLKTDDKENKEIKELYINEEQQNSNNINNIDKNNIEFDQLKNK